MIPGRLAKTIRHTHRFCSSFCEPRSTAPGDFIAGLTSLKTTVSAHGQALSSWPTQPVSDQAPVHSQSAEDQLAFSIR